jgi:hypothetical protein
MREAISGTQGKEKHKEPMTYKGSVLFQKQGCMVDTYMSLPSSFMCKCRSDLSYEGGGP